MVHYVVQARMKPERTAELREKPESGAFDTIRPLAREISSALRRARRDPAAGEAVWEEQCFCSPPLAAERPAILDRCFDDITTEEVTVGEGWARTERLPGLWSTWSWKCTLGS